ncbi:MAG: class I SAM-dependent methyltransferase [Candidatus Woesearchaeota archaeon]
MTRAKLKEIMEQGSKERFGRMDDYMDRKDRDEPFVWDIGAWLASEFQDKRNNGIVYPSGSIKLLDIGPAIGAVSSYLTINALHKGTGENITNIQLYLCDISGEVIHKTIAGEYIIPYHIFSKRTHMDGKIVDDISRIIRNAQGKTGNVQELPYADNTFDLTVANFILHHIPNADKGKAAREIQRVTKDGGFIIISDEYIPKQLSIQYLERHQHEDIPLAKEEFMTLKQVLRRFNQIYLQGLTYGKEYYAFYGINSEDSMLWQHKEYLKDRNILL